MTPQHRTLLLLGGRGSRVRVYVHGDLVRVRSRVTGARRHFIGDKDLRVVNKSYTKRRDHQLREVVERLDQTRKVNESATEEGGEFAKLLTDGEPLVGFEPTTARLRIESSTPELQWLVS